MERSQVPRKSRNEEHRRVGTTIAEKEGVWVQWMFGTLRVGRVKRISWMKSIGLLGGKDMYLMSLRMVQRKRN